MYFYETLADKELKLGEPDLEQTGNLNPEREIYKTVPARTRASKVLSFHPSSVTLTIYMLKS